MPEGEIFFETGKRIEAIRGSLTQAAFAERLGVDRKSVTGWEKGRRLPDGESLLKLVKEFGADLNYLLTGVTSAGVAPELPPDESALLDNYRNSPSDGREKIRQTSLVAAKSPRNRRSAGG